jgi:hypothetical protein
VTLRIAQDREYRRRLGLDAPLDFDPLARHAHILSFPAIAGVGLGGRASPRAGTGDWLKARKESSAWGSTSYSYRDKALKAGTVRTIGASGGYFSVETP